MDYEKALETIHKRLVFGSKPGLERIDGYLKVLGRPHKKLKYIHVAGTNGKGSTCTFIASILKNAGYKVGLYTSPYVLDFRERMQINGEMISKKELTQLVKDTLEATYLYEKENESLTEFEYITALAFKYFHENQCDIVVLETGLGGRFDATNVIKDKEVAVLTSISLDHTAVLGETLKQITEEKCGILKNKSRLVIYPIQEQEVLDTIFSKCEEKDISFIIPKHKKNKILSQELCSTKAEVEDIKIKIPFAGIHQVYNAQTAINAVKLFNKKIKDEDIKKGIREAFIPARMELLSEDPTVILDGGHNEGCAKALDAFMKKHKGHKKATAIMGMMSDKDSISFLEKVAKHFKKIITVAPNNPRALSAEKLSELASAYTVAQSAETVEQACEMALLEKSDMIFICGSLYLAAEIRPVMKNMLATYTK